ncbi:MAG: heterodisulfide reductase-related iron-sulfur binding cluster, partial [Desulfovibrionaceae bacterium]|nr:heterodisulfide reductase-related iron-sulfur binding cluster [Desulfovibrionaceae bacterium]
ATFVLHPRLKHSRVMVWEFYGSSMHNAALAINDLIALRVLFAAKGGLVKLTKLEEFGSKYVQAIEYKKKSLKHEGDPISVLILQLDSDDQDALNWAVGEAEKTAAGYAGVDAFLAKDENEAELFWEDRHKLPAIAKRTSGFKINEDVVIPLAALPDFALFLEDLNLEYMARAYRRALQEIGLLRGLAEDDREFNREFTYASRLIKGERTAEGQEQGELTEQGLRLHVVLYLNKLRGMYPQLAEKILRIEEKMLKSQVVAASHMHAGDGNCHVNLPVNSGDVDMVAEAGEAAFRVMAKAKELGGAVTGEHGVGITKIAFLDNERLAELREFKALVDPHNIINPAKLTQKELPVSPFTFSFNRLIEDLNQSGLPEKERLIELLTMVQICTRCGKCKDVCAGYYPEEDLLYNPRNRNMSLGALLEAVYYSQVNSGVIDRELLKELREMMEFCTGCNKCLAVCPVRINSQEVTLTLRAFLEKEGEGGHPFKNRVIAYLAEDLPARFPRFAKAASLGQRMANRTLPLVPSSLRARLYNPLFSGPGPLTGYRNIFESLKLERGSLFAPKEETKGTALYFPGCAGSMFYRAIGISGAALLLKAGWAVFLPPEAICCGYPALSAGLQDIFRGNQQTNMETLGAWTKKATRLGYPISRILTACGTCRDGLERYALEKLPDVTFTEGESPLADVFQFLSRNMPDKDASHSASAKAGLIYHVPCHAEWSGAAKNKAAEIYAEALNRHSGRKTLISRHCCAESGVGAVISPLEHNILRRRKAADLREAMTLTEDEAPVLVGCPSCKMGVIRTLMGLKQKRPVLHTLEFLAGEAFGQDWRRRVRKLLSGATAAGDGLRLVDMEGSGAIAPGQDQDEEKEEDEQA